ncbi:MAG: hypothetical protein Q7S95_00635 [bacterium]|nr:hypothetical protein [bacterium]
MAYERRLFAKFAYEADGAGKHEIIATVPTSYGDHEFMVYRLKYALSAGNIMNNIGYLDLELPKVYTGEHLGKVALVCDQEFALMMSEVFGYFAYVRAFLYEHKTEAPSFEAYLFHCARPELTLPAIKHAA